MADKDKVKELCQQLINELGGSAHFNYVIENHILIGACFEASKFGIAPGIKNNIIGTTHACSNLFYQLILIYLKQIQDLQGYTNEQAVVALTTKLMKDIKELDEIEPIMNYRKYDLAKGGNA